MAGLTRSRDEIISSFAGSLFAAMISEVIMDTALQAHKDIVRGKAICEVCGMRCSSVHTKSALPNVSASATSVPACPGSPATVKRAAGMSTPTTKDKNDGNIYFECTHCQKKIASNRYAPHLSGCLNIGTGSRRGAARNAAVKNKAGADLDRSGSPLVGEDYSSPPETVNGKGKGRFKNGKKITGKALEPGLNGISKRPMTPDGPPSKKVKKQKLSTVYLEQSVEPVLEKTGLEKSHISSTAKRPPKSGTMSGSPHAPGSPSAASVSQYSGHDSPSASNSSFNSQSPTRLSGVQKIPPADTNSSNSKRRGRPPGSGKNQLAAAEAAVVKRKLREDKGEDQDFIDVDGEDHDESSSGSP